MLYGMNRTAPLSCGLTFAFECIIVRAFDSVYPSCLRNPFYGTNSGIESWQHSAKIYA
jgi:hypothetical protein